MEVSGLSGNYVNLGVLGPFFGLSGELTLPLWSSGGQTHPNPSIAHTGIITVAVFGTITSLHYASKWNEEQFYLFLAFTNGHFTED